MTRNRLELGKLETRTERKIGNGNQFIEERSDMLDDEFYNEEEIRRFNANIDQMSQLHSQVLDVVELSNSKSSEPLESVVEETRSLSASLKKRIKLL